MVEIIRKGNLGPYLYHFTDSRNVPSIKQNGLLSRRELESRKINGFIPGGNQWSLDADIQKGVDAYVHLSFIRRPGMLHTALTEGRIQDEKVLGILPEIILTKGVFFTNVVSNSSEATFFTVDGFNETNFDLQVLLDRTDWTDQAIKERLNIVKKYEILIPTMVPVEYIKF